MDPSLFDKPVTTDEWRKRQGDPPGSYAETSTSAAYFQNKKLGVVPGGVNAAVYEEDPTGDVTRDKMSDHQHVRDKALADEAAKGSKVKP